MLRFFIIFFFFDDPLLFLHAFIGLLRRIACRREGKKRMLKFLIL